MVKNLLKACCMIAALTAAGQAAAETYTVGSGGTYRPFEFENSQKQLEGFDIDIIKAIAKAEGFDVKLVNTPWEGIFATLNTGDRDIIMSGITITPQRQQTVDFSLPYFAAHQLILTQRNLRVKSINDLKGKKVAVVANSAGDIVCSKAFGKASPNIKRFDNTPLALEELNAGGVDAAIGDVGVFAYYAQQNPGKHFNMTRDPNFEEQYFGIAVRKGNTKLLAQINDGLRKVYKNGTYAKVYHKWFGNTPVPKLPIK